MSWVQEVITSEVSILTPHSFHLVSWKPNLKKPNAYMTPGCLQVSWQTKWNLQWNCWSCWYINITAMRRAATKEPKFGLKLKKKKKRSVVAAYTPQCAKRIPAQLPFSFPFPGTGGGGGGEVHSVVHFFVF